MWMGLFIGFFLGTSTGWLAHQIFIDRWLRDKLYRVDAVLTKLKQAEEVQASYRKEGLH
jgi:hypothetical protein